MHFMAIIAAVVEVITAIAAVAICYHAVCCNIMDRQNRQGTRKRSQTPKDTYPDRSLDRYKKRKAEKEREKELDGDQHLKELGKEEAPRFVFRPPVKRTHNVRFY